MKTWIAVDGSLSDIDYPGDSSFRSPEQLAQFVFENISKPGDWIFDPFAGFGTAQKVAQRMDRHAIGVEIDPSRAAFANKGLRQPNQVMCASASEIPELGLPRFDLVYTSPPYITVQLSDDPWGETYFEDMHLIFSGIQTVLKPDAAIVVEVSNISTEDGFRPLTWQFGELLSSIFTLKGEMVRCNTGDSQAGPGVDHSSLLILKNSIIAAGAIG